MCFSILCPLSIFYFKFKLLIPLQWCFSVCIFLVNKESETIAYDSHALNMPCGRILHTAHNYYEFYSRNETCRGRVCFQQIFVAFYLTLPFWTVLISEIVSYFTLMLDCFLYCAFKCFCLISPFNFNWWWKWVWFKRFFFPCWWFHKVSTSFVNEIITIEMEA